MIGGDAKTFEEKSKAIAETMNQNANNESFTSFVESELFNAENWEYDFINQQIETGDVDDEMNHRVVGKNINKKE